VRTIFSDNQVESDGWATGSLICALRGAKYAQNDAHVQHSMENRCQCECYSFGEDDNLGPSILSADNTLALRLAGGIDFPIIQYRVLNTELAWKRNNGSFEFNGANQGTFDASALNFFVFLAGYDRRDC